MKNFLVILANLAVFLFFLLVVTDECVVISGIFALLVWMLFLKIAGRVQNYRDRKKEKGII